MALISLEDLDGLDDEQMAEDTADGSEAREEMESQRLLNHWQSVGRTHHVSVPAGGGLSHTPGHHTEIKLAWAIFWISCLDRNDRTDPGDDPPEPSEGADPVHNHLLLPGQGK